MELEMAGNIMSKTSWTSRWVRFSSSCDDEFITGKSLVWRLDLELLINFFDGDNFCIGKDTSTQFLNFIFQSLNDGPWFICLRENTSVILNLEFDTIVLEKSNDIVVIKLWKDAIEETSITRNAC